MKVLHEQDGVQLACHDRNYIVHEKYVVPEVDRSGSSNEHAGEVSYTKPAYYSKINQAVSAFCERLAVNLCTDLHSWLRRYEEAHRGIDLTIDRVLKEVK